MRPSAPLSTLKAHQVVATLPVTVFRGHGRQVPKRINDATSSCTVATRAPVEILRRFKAPHTSSDCESPRDGGLQDIVQNRRTPRARERSLRQESTLRASGFVAE